MHQKKIYGRTNINYVEPSKAHNQHTLESTHDVSESFVSSHSLSPLSRTIEDIRIRKFKYMDTTLLTTTLLDYVHDQDHCDEQEVRTALEIASTLHVHDFRNSPRSTVEKPPYMEHVLRVAVRPMRYFQCIDQDITISALLHDTVEDHATDFAPGIEEQQARTVLLDYYEQEFGENVRNAVQGLTNPLMEPGMPKEDKRALYQQHVMESVRDNDVVLMVKASDFIDNAGSLHLTHTKGHSSTNHLVKKYSPMVDFFIDAVSESSYDQQIQQSLTKRIIAVGDGLDSLR